MGGDKDIPYLGLKKEENPFLGYRAIRYCLGHQEMFRAQLRALLRASAFGRVKIMLPLVTRLDEVRARMAGGLSDELLSDETLFGCDLVQNGMAAVVRAKFSEMMQGKGAVRRALKKVLTE